MTDRISAEQFAEAIYQYKTVLAVFYGKAPKDPPQRNWSEIPSDERELLIASAKLALVDPDG